jgi:exoribonuclease-2
VNPWQIIACARHGKTAALVAPFKPKDAELFAILSGFDAAYAAYGAFQGAIERFWTLQYLAQNDIHELVAVLFKDNLVRAESLPLVLPVIGAQDLPRGARVRVRLGAVDTIALDVTGSVIERLDAPAIGDPAALEDEGDDEVVAGPLAIAVELDGTADAPAAGGDNPAS